MSQTQQQRTTPAVSIASPNEACASWFLRLCLGSDCRDRGQLTVCLECFEDRSETTTRFTAGSEQNSSTTGPFGNARWALVALVADFWRRSPKRAGRRTGKYTPGAC